MVVVVVTTRWLHIAAKSSAPGRLCTVIFILFNERRMLANNGLVKVGDIGDEMAQNGSNAATRSFPGVMVVVVMVVVLSPCKQKNGTTLSLQFAC